MKRKLYLLAGFMAITTLLFGWVDVQAWVDGETGQPGAYGTWISLIPPLVAIGLALITREVILSLFAGIWIGALFLVSFNPFDGTARSLDILIDALVNADHIAIIVFSLLLGGMVGVMSRGGGTQGIVDQLSKFATTRKKGQLFSWFSAFFIFFDDYANTLIRGNALRPMTDRLNISREKLAYIVDSTAAPLAVSAVITTWIGFEITQIQNALSGLAAQTTDAALATQLQAGADNAFIIFLHSIPYLFYPILALAFVVMTIVMRKEFGPMLTAERRAYSGGGVIRPGSTPATDTNLETMQPIEGKPKRWINAALPVISVIVVALYGLYTTGASALAEGESGLTNIIGNADPFAALLWASFTGCAVAIGLVVFQKVLTLNQALESWVGGMQSMLMAVIILILAWGLGGVTQEIGTGTYLASLLEDNLPLALLPGLVFFIAAVTAFSTGTSWGTMAILFPVVVPLAVAMGAGIGFAGGEHYSILLGSVSSVMAGAVFGDHCSPISDTTVLSSMSSACDLIDHVRTQLPYALVIAGVAIVVGEIPAAFEFIHPIWGILAGLVILWFILKTFGRDPEVMPEKVTQD
ncbi:MAG: Na+/H+ antiporter NhaC family protein [Balneolaceae bacterium]|nr:Na+/H+ antiporter NhaC family protein [Balneolaceae bacterium]MCH8548018.1 Na+/H+ antiporter NhaC family protein [Balneolaceae bacterium]